VSFILLEINSKERRKYSGCLGDKKLSKEKFFPCIFEDPAIEALPSFDSFHNGDSRVSR